MYPGAVPEAGVKRGAGPDVARRIADASASSVLARALTERQFLKRPLSWTATVDGLFLKVARRSQDPAIDVDDPGARSEIEEEFRVTDLLSRLSADVPPPVAHVPGCLVKRAIDLVDLRDELMSLRTGGDVDRSLGEAIRVCATIHRATIGGTSGERTYDYTMDPFLPATTELAAVMRRRPYVLVCRGLEVRNFVRDRVTGRLAFFDPHEVVMGIPEEDVTRFLVSVLMVGWGRSGISLPWTKFSTASILDAYQREGLSLDAGLLDYGMRNAIAMRRHFAMKAASAMPAGVRSVAAAYTRYYFSRLDRWRRAHAF